MIKILTIHISTIFFTFYKSLTNIYTNLLNHMHIQTPHLYILTLSHIDEAVTRLGGAMTLLNFFFFFKYYYINRY